MKLSSTAKSVRLSGLAALTAFGLIGATHAASVNLVTNGGFEQTTMTGSYQINQTNVTGWSNTVSGVGGRGYFNYVFFPGTADTTGALPSTNPDGSAFKLWGPNDGSNNGLTATSPAGGNFLAADGDSGYRAPITQMISGLVVGALYDLNFYYAGAQQNQRTGATTDAWQVSLGNQVQNTPTLNVASMGFSGWRSIDMMFTATSTQELLSFLAIGTPNGLPPMALLDGVSLTQVPEPGSLALLGIGLFGMMQARRKQKSA
jgi:hypothetical protein